MTEFSQGDIIKIRGFDNPFLIVSNNAFIRATNIFHVCPVLQIDKGALHIELTGKNGTKGVAVCEQIKLIDGTQKHFGTFPVTFCIIFGKISACGRAEAKVNQK